MLESEKSKASTGTAKPENPALSSSGPVHPSSGTAKPGSSSSSSCGPVHPGPDVEKELEGYRTLLNLERERVVELESAVSGLQDKLEVCVYVCCGNDVTLCICVYVYGSGVGECCFWAAGQA